VLQHTKDDQALWEYLPDGWLKHPDHADMHYFWRVLNKQDHARVLVLLEELKEELKRLEVIEDEFVDIEEDELDLLLAGEDIGKFSKSFLIWFSFFRSPIEAG